MMFVVRGVGSLPETPAIGVKAVRKTPEIVAGAAGKTDWFCVGAAEAMAALRAQGHEVVELRDGWYEDDVGGGIAIFGHGKYWELRDTPFTVVDAARPVAQDAAPADNVVADQVDVRGAVFGV